MIKKALIFLKTKNSGFIIKIIKNLQALVSQTNHIFVRSVGTLQLRSTIIAGRPSRIYHSSKKNCYLVLHKRRYACSYGKKFYEPYEFLPRYLHQTKRLTWKIADLLHETASLKSVAKASNVSVTTVCRILDSIHYSCPPLKEAVSIDEFKGNARTGKYQCILVNPKNHSIMDILPDRTQSHLTSYFREIDRAQRLRVKYFVCDMWQPYVDLAHTFFPNAKVCIDKYHFFYPAGHLGNGECTQTSAEDHDHYYA